jgi:multidrug efflux pump subunit AcrA (membrane-fusion protein)
MRSLTHFKASLLPLFLAILLSGCGAEKNPPASAQNKPAHGHVEPQGAKEEGAVFEVGKGILLSEETRKAITLQTVEVTSEKILHTVDSKAQIYREAHERRSSSGWMRSGYAYGSAFVSIAEAADLNIGKIVNLRAGAADSEIKGKIARLDRQAESVTGQVEVLIEVPDLEGHFQLGQFLDVKMDADGSISDTVVPSSSVLKTPSGTFVYVRNGEHYIRTDVKTGMEGGGLVEIREGLYEGDTLVSNPVEKLWLIELRAVKGGGHCH